MDEHRAREVAMTGVTTFAMTTSAMLALVSGVLTAESRARARRYDQRSRERDRPLRERVAGEQGPGAERKIARDLKAKLFK
jgi:hypothetical protein